jgi:hypothetical protein
LIEQVDLNNVIFISNDHLIESVTRITASPEHVKEAVRINTDARLRALRLSLFFLAGLAFLVIIPAGELSNHVPGKAPSGRP